MSERHRLLREFEAQLRGARPGFAEILDALAESVTIRDADNHILYANRAALQYMGFASLEEMQRQPLQTILDDYLVQDEHGDEVTMDQIPSVRLLAGEVAEPLVIRTIHRSTGDLRWQLLKAAPLHDDGDRPIASVMVIEDITRQRIAELRDRFMARASETLMSSIDYQETLRNVAWLAVPEIADWCTVELIDERGVRQQLVVAHRDGAKLELAERLRGFEPERLDPDRGVGRVLSTGASMLVEQIPDEALVAAAVNEEQTGSAFFHEFVEDIFPLSYQTTQVLAKELGLAQAKRTVSVLDLAAGSGVWGIGLAKASPQVRVTAVDWAGVLPVTKRVAARHGVAERFHFVEGDLLQADFGRGTTWPLSATSSTVRGPSAAGRCCAKRSPP
jgi:PAS domain S-box-containing protein